MSKQNETNLLNYIFDLENKLIDMEKHRNEWRERCKEMAGAFYNSSNDFPRMPTDCLEWEIENE